MQDQVPRLLRDVARYYSEKLALHGDTPRGVDWKDEASQTLRFQQLCQVIRSHDRPTVNDLGCGYGALLPYLDSIHPGCGYLGIDVSESMVRAAAQRFERHPRARFLHGSEPDRVADYSVASGIFNVRLTHSDADWQAYLRATLDVLNRCSRLGFAFNGLTSYADQDKKRTDLYYADPCALFDLCKRRYSSRVALLHDYPLWEFTVLVRTL